jgi:enoyl-CoA hydratase
VNQAYDNMGLATTQLLGPILDGYMRNTPEGHAFVETARRRGSARRAQSATRPSATTAKRPRPANLGEGGRGDRACFAGSC